MKKTLAIILAVILLVSCTVTTAFAGMDNFQKINTYKDGQFTDVKAAAWYAENIKVAYEMGLVKGASANTFNVKGNLTVAETIALASRIHKMYKEGNADFVQGSPWYQVYLDYFEGTIAGGKTYLPAMNSACTRGLFAVIMSAAIPEEMEFINNVTFEDIPDVGSGHRYGNNILYLMKSGIITGYEDGSFRPDNTISRAEVCAIVTRLADPTLRKHIELNNISDKSYYPEYKDVPDFGYIFGVPVYEKEVIDPTKYGFSGVSYAYDTNDLYAKYTGKIGSDDDVDEYVYETYVDKLETSGFEMIDYVEESDHLEFVFYKPDTDYAVALSFGYADDGFYWLVVVVDTK